MVCINRALLLEAEKMSGRLMSIKGHSDKEKNVHHVDLSFELGRQQYTSVRLEFETRGEYRSALEYWEKLYEFGSSIE